MLDNERNYCKLIPSTNRIVVRLKFRHPGVKGKQRISQWAKSNIRMEGITGSAKKQQWRFILTSAPLPDR
ncbi:TPA: hypothetical protein HNC40_26600 [Escherichia coli]|nr:hypothetical protein [Escherichia coli]